MNTYNKHRIMNEEYDIQSLQENFGDEFTTTRFELDNFEIIDVESINHEYSEGYDGDSIDEKKMFDEEVAGRYFNTPIEEEGSMSLGNRLHFDPFGLKKIVKKNRSAYNLFIMDRVVVFDL